MSFYTSVIPYGNYILLREVDDFGNRVQRRIKGFAPELFLPTNDPSKAVAESIDGTKLTKCQDIDTISKAKEFVYNYRDVEDFDVYGTTNWAIQFILSNYPDQIEFDSSKIRIFNVDIEVYAKDSFPHPEDAVYPINLIQLIDSDDPSTVRVWGTGTIEPIPDTIYTQCHDEQELLLKFLEYWESNCPDVLTGWNIKGFDVPYICNRLKTLFGEATMSRLSPWKNVRETNYRNDFGQQQMTHLIDGVSVLDYLDLYKKYTYTNQESYTLDHIGHVELKERKVDYSEIGTLHGLCDTNYQKFVEYGVKDVRLVQRLDDKMKLLDLVFTIAYMTKQNYTDTFSPVKTWETLIYTKLRHEGRYTKIKTKNDNVRHRKIAGAYVQQPETGKMRRWVLSFDLNSLYPHLIMQYNIGFETMRNKDPNYIAPSFDGGDLRLNDLEKLVVAEFDTSYAKEQCCSMTASGFLFDNSKQSILSEFMESIYFGRKQTKKEMLRLSQIREEVKNEMTRRGLM